MLNVPWENLQAATFDSPQLDNNLQKVGYFMFVLM